MYKDKTMHCMISDVFNFLKIQNSKLNLLRANVDQVLWIISGLYCKRGYLCDTEY